MPTGKHPKIGIIHRPEGGIMKITGKITILIDTGKMKKKKVVDGREGMIKRLIKEKSLQRKWR